MQSSWHPDADDADSATEAAKMREIARDVDATRFERMRDALWAQGAVRDRAASIKEVANDHFREERFAMAQKGYLTALWLLGPHDQPFPHGIIELEKPRVPESPRCADAHDGLLLQLLSNAAAAALKLDDAEGAARMARAALELNPQDRKALLRLARALEDLGDSDAAIDRILERAGAAKERLAFRERRVARRKRFDGLFQGPPLYPQAEQRRRRREARAPLVLDPVKDAGRLHAIEDRARKRHQRLSRISPQDRLRLSQMEEEAATASEIADFYSRARHAEARRVGERMTENERTVFFELCQSTDDEAQIDAAFDVIRRRVDETDGATPPRQDPVWTSPFAPLFAALRRTGEPQDVSP